MTSTSVDVAILGFYQIVEDKDGNVVKEGEVFRKRITFLIQSKKQ